MTVLGAVLIGFGANKLLAHLFLGFWYVATAPEVDLQVRGIWLLALLLPTLTKLSAAGSALAVTWMTRRRPGGLIRRGMVALAGAAMGAVLIEMGLDPTVYPLHLLRPTLVYDGASLSVAVALMCCGWRVVRADR